MITILAMKPPIVTQGILDLNNLENYAEQPIPPYITKDNTPIDNPITDAGATLGRVLFYDKKLSIDESISCASCHQQEAAFSDTNDMSTGVNGMTDRHSPRLINLRFGEETKFFWDETASSLEALTMTPIQDHIEMGFTGNNGQPGLDDLFNRLESIDYYQELFAFVYGDATVNQERIEKSVAQFLRSIQSFDSKYDEGRINVTHDSIPFSNFNAGENLGKQLFIDSPVFDDLGNRVAGGAGCAQCHHPPEFDIDPDSGNNGDIGVFGSTTEIDISITRVPTLRNLADDNMVPFGGFMHNSSMGGEAKIYGVIDHYNEIPDVTNNPNIDERLVPNGHPQRLHITTLERIQLVQFLKTLKGDDVLFNKKWSNPFSNGTLTVIPLSTTSTIEPSETNKVGIFPNPFKRSSTIHLQMNASSKIDLTLFNTEGKVVSKIVDQMQLEEGSHSFTIDRKNMNAGVYYVILKTELEHVVVKLVVV